MEKLVDVFLTFPSSQNLSDQELNKQAATLINTLNKTPAATLASNSNGTDLLTILNPTANSLVYLYVLYVLKGLWDHSGILMD
jgi:COP9 signalosome complex subunit 3